MLSSKGFLALLFTSRFLINLELIFFCLYDKAVIWETFLPIWISKCPTPFMKSLSIHHWSAMPPLRYVKVHVFLDLFLKFCSTVYTTAPALIHRLIYCSLTSGGAGEPILWLFKNISSLLGSFHSLVFKNHLNKSHKNNWDFDCNYIGSVDQFGENGQFHNI